MAYTALTGLFDFARNRFAGLLFVSVYLGRLSRAHHGTSIAAAVYEESVSLVG